MEEKQMNVYRFSLDSSTYKIVVAPDVTVAAKQVEFEWVNIKKIYQNVTIAYD